MTPHRYARAPQAAAWRSRCVGWSDRALPGSDLLQQELKRPNGPEYSASISPSFFVPLNSAQFHEMGERPLKVEDDALRGYILALTHSADIVDSRLLKLLGHLPHLSK